MFSSIFLHLGHFKFGISFRDEKYSLRNFEIGEFIDSSQKITSSRVNLLANFSKELKKTTLSFETNNYLLGNSQSNLFKSRTNAVKKYIILGIKNPILFPNNFNCIFNRVYRKVILIL